MDGEGEALVGLHQEGGGQQMASELSFKVGERKNSKLGWASAG